MYTWEIEKIIGENNGILNSKTYLDICKTSPQINRIKYDAFTDTFSIWTYDKEGEIQFKVIKNENT